jgi:hypothetical protein
MSTAFSDACSHPFPRVWCNPMKSFCLTDAVQPARFWRFIWHGRIGKGSLNSVWKVKIERDGRWCSAVNTRCICENTSFLFDRLKTTDGLAQASYNMTWPAWALVQSQRYCVFMNPVELYWTWATSKFLTWVACLFSYSVYDVLVRIAWSCVTFFAWIARRLFSPTLLFY